MRIPRPLKVFFLGLLAVGWVAFGSASALTSGDEHPGSLAMLLVNKNVGKELKLSSLQMAVLKSLKEEYRDAMKELSDPLPTTSEARSAARDKFRSLNTDFNSRALSVLNETQRSRFAEIEHQALGANSLTRPSVQKALGLTERQKQNVEKIRSKGVAYLNKINRQWADGKVTPARRLELLSRRRVSQTKDLYNVLTPEQKTALAQLGGKPLSAPAASR